MTNHSKAAATMLWFKELTISSTSMFKKRLNLLGLSGISKKSLIFIGSLWVMAVILVTVYSNALQRDQQQTFFTAEVATVGRLADQCASLLLEDDSLGLNRVISDFAKGRFIRFAAILNHENHIVAHSNPDQLNRPFVETQGQTILQEVDRVSIRKVVDNERIIFNFQRDIDFSGVRIGKVVVGEFADALLLLQRRSRRNAGLAYAIITVAVFGLLFLFGRVRAESPSSPIDKIQETPDGTRIGPYQLRRLIARGGMAELYQADYLRSDGFRRSVAIKKVLPHLVEYDDFIQMFIREARLAALLQHPNIVQIFDFGKIQNSYFIAMEYIDGLTLGEIMSRLQTGLPIDMAVYIALKITQGLDYSHRRKDDDTGNPLGIIHRDISPQNILISYQGEVKLSDFGISKATTEPSLTQAGVIKGKLSYLSPEQALGKPADMQSDLYSLGLVMYEILSGRQLCQFDSEIDAIRSIPEMEIEQLITVRPEVPEQLNRIVMRCLEKQPERRYPDAADLQRALIDLKNQTYMAYDGSSLSHFLKTNFQDES